MKNLKIMLDDGHGWETKGKRSPDGEFRENEFNSDLIARIGYGLYCNNIEYRFVSEGRKDMSLDERVEKIAKYRPDFLLSVHADAWEGLNGEGGWQPKADGFTTYHYDSLQTARMFHEYVSTGNPMKDRGVKYGNYQILRETKDICSGVLFEGGYMTNQNNLIYLRSNLYKDFLADSVVGFINQHEYLVG